MHWQHFPQDLTSIHVWRQTQTQSTIINFYEEDMNILHPRRNDRGNTDGIFRMEFPLMQWLIACLYKIFGNHLIISRLFMFVTGLFTVFGIYKLLDALFHNTALAVTGAWAFNFSPGFFYYTINPMPDNMALCFSVWGLAMFFTWVNNKKLINLILSSVFLSAGALCKLPFMIYYIVPAVYFSVLSVKKGFKKPIIIQLLSVMSLSVLPMAWYLKVIPGWHGNPVVKGIFNNQESWFTLLDYFQHNLFSTLPELLLNYGSLPFFLAGFYYFFKKRAYRNPVFVPVFSLSILVLAYYFFEANAIGKIHDYYLFPFYPLLFILVAYGAFNLYRSGNKSARYLTLFLLIILPLTCYLRMRGRWDPDSPGFNRDLLVYKTELRDAVPKDALVVAGNDISHYIFLYYIDKKGWVFDNDNLPEDTLKKMIEEGATYLYTDSEKIPGKNDLACCIDKIVLKKGSIKVFRLKKPVCTAQTEQPQKGGRDVSVISPGTQ